MNLYKVTVCYEKSDRARYYVIAKDEKSAKDYTMKKWSEWGYWRGAYVSIIELLASEGQYGNPEVLLISKEQTK
jgi:hypothetical protein